MAIDAVDRDLVLEGYIACALWSSNDNSDPDTGGNPLDESYCPWDISEESRLRMAEDVAAFLEKAGPLAERLLDESLVPRADYIGHDFWLTRNRHGAGFWDRGFPGTLGDDLTAVAESFGEGFLFVGDDGRLYFEKG
jgi:hypothetical protein